MCYSIELNIILIHDNHWRVDVYINVMIHEQLQILLPGLSQNISSLQI